MPLDTWQRLIDLNLISASICTKLVGGEMVRRSNGGGGINLASIAGIIANRGIGGQGYERAEAAVIAVTRAPAADWAPHGVTVSAIAPGGFRTDPNLRGSRSIRSSSSRSRPRCR